MGKGGAFEYRLPSLPASTSFVSFPFCQCVLLHFVDGLFADAKADYLPHFPFMHIHI